jgi:hypothetical protein
MWSAAFSASMMVGAFKLPLVICGMIDASTTHTLSRPNDTCCLVHDHHRIVRPAHAARATWMVSALCPFTNKIVERVIADRFRTRRELGSAEWIECRLAEDLSRMPDRRPHLEPIVGMAHVIEVDHGSS